MIKNIKPLPISVERLGAYLEGKLSAVECNEIEDLISSNKDFEDFVNEISQHIPATNETIYDSNPNFDIEFELPELPKMIDSSDDNIVYGDEIDYDAISQVELTEMLKAWAESVTEVSNNNINITDYIGEHLQETAGSIGNKNYGYEPNYNLDLFDPNIYQGANNTCAIRCQQIVLRDYGIMFSQDDLVEYATKKGWFDPDPENGGTDKNAVGNIIDDCGIKTIRTDNATIYDIIAELRAGHRVIVTVDADELWVKRQPNVFKRLFGRVKNSFNDSIQDVMGVEGANHALIVAGVNVNPNDPKDIHVTLIDTGTGEMCVEYTFKEFENAWKDGNHRMVSTNIPAPYQYNSETHQMEPSGFVTEYRPSMADIPHDLVNQFKLSNNYLAKFRDYKATYNETSHKIGVTFTIETNLDNEVKNDNVNHINDYKNEETDTTQYEYKEESGNDKHTALDCPKPDDDECDNTLTDGYNYNGEDGEVETEYNG